ncbi:MAG: type II toxin-antitoxin system VapC family toxin [Leptospira sp.]|nr:type II toxin-antitoxin system VapC family toxin [Leptospira sp.]
MVILDASIAVKWFVDENESDLAISVLEELLYSPKDFAVPELFFYEIHSVLHKIPEIDVHHITQFTDRLQVSGLRRFPMTPELWGLTQFFLKYGISSYDASYAALARFLSGHWLTADLKAHKSLKKEKISTLLSDWK